MPRALRARGTIPRKQIAGSAVGRAAPSKTLVGTSLRVVGRHPPPDYWSAPASGSLVGTRLRYAGRHPPPGRWSASASGMLVGTRLRYVGRHPPPGRWSASASGLRPPRTALQAIPQSVPAHSGEQERLPPAPTARKGWRWNTLHHAEIMVITIEHIRENLSRPRGHRQA